MCITVYTSGIFRLKLSQAKFGAKTHGVILFWYNDLRTYHIPDKKQANMLLKNSLTFCETVLYEHVLLFQIDIMCQIRTGAILTSLQNYVHGVTGGTYANTCRLYMYMQN